MLFLSSFFFFKATHAAVLSKLKRCLNISNKAIKTPNKDIGLILQKVPVIQTLTNLMQTVIAVAGKALQI